MSGKKGAKHASPKSVNSAGEKCCVKCGSTSNGFNKKSDCAHGLRSICKVCQRAAGKEYHARTRDRKIAYGRSYRLENAGKCAAYRAKNRERINARKRAYIQENMALILKKNAGYAAKNPERVRGWKQKWKRENRLAGAIHAQTRRARKVSVGGTFTKADVETLQIQQRNKCAAPWCRRPLEKFHVDHIVPLALGGSNDRLNLQLLCPLCNVQKGYRDPIVHAQRMGCLL